MNKRQESKLGMYDSVIAHCADNGAIVSLILAFSNAVAKLTTIVTAIRKAVQAQTEKGTGATNKQTNREDVCQLSKSMADAVFAYAEEINDGDLKAKVTYSISELRDLKDEDLPSKSQGIHDIAKPLAAQLADFGIVTQDFPDLQTAIDTYTNSIANPTTVKGHKKLATTNLTQYYADADKILKNTMDKTVEKYRKNNSDFVIEYYNARLIIDSPTTHTTIRGTFIDAITQEPIPNGQFVLAGFDTKVKTDSKGRFVYQTKKPGKFDGMASAPGYADKDFPNIEAKLGKITTLKVVLTPVE